MYSNFYFKLCRFEVSTLLTVCRILSSLNPLTMQFSEEASLYQARQTYLGASLGLFLPPNKLRRQTDRSVSARSRAVAQRKRSVYGCVRVTLTPLVQKTNKQKKAFSFITFKSTHT